MNLFGPFLGMPCASRGYLFFYPQGVSYREDSFTLLADKALDLSTWREQFQESSQPADASAFSDHLASHYVPNSVIVDATASEEPALRYLEWMQKGLHIITPNKKLNSGPLDQYLALRQFQRESYIHYFYEVCALCPHFFLWSSPMEHKVAQKYMW